MNEISEFSDSAFQIHNIRDQTIKQMDFNAAYNQDAKHDLFGQHGVPIDYLLWKHKKKNHQKNLVRNIIMKNKVKNLTNNFIKKIRRNSVFRPPVEDNIIGQSSLHDKNMFIDKAKEWLKQWGSKDGLILGNITLAAWSLINIFQITLMVFVFSIMVTFAQTEDIELFLYFRIFSVILYMIDMVLNFITQHYQSGHKVEKISQISKHYLKNGFIIDLCSIIIFPISLFVGSNITIIISFVALIKLKNNLKKIEKFQYLCINTPERQQYYGLITIFLMNFVIGHFLSIILNLMVFIDHSNNWIIRLGIQHSEWYIKYIWGYYWGTNIMLTVGFGDVSASNQYEALLLVFIETLSCVTLAYNISSVGTLIKSMRQKVQFKNKQLKTFHRMCSENQISTEVERKISNYIDQSYRIKLAFQYDYEEEVISFLPKAMQSEYRKEANKILFNSLGFLSNLSKKSLLKLAQSVSRKICHPEQIIIKKGSHSDFIILKNGTLGFACKILSNLNGQVMETLTVSQKSKPKIFSLDFIKNNILNFNLKSIGYSVLFYLSREDFMLALRNSEMDYQLFCMIRDRDEYMLDQNQLYTCSICKTQHHNKFKCSKLHYSPLKQWVIRKYLDTSNKAKQPRNNFIRNVFHVRISSNSSLNPLKSSKKYKKLNKTRFTALHDLVMVKSSQMQYLKDHTDEEQFNNIQKLMDFYLKIGIQQQDLKNSKKKSKVNAALLQLGKDRDSKDSIIEVISSNPSQKEKNCQEIDSFSLSLKKKNRNKQNIQKECESVSLQKINSVEKQMNEIKVLPNKKYIYPRNIVKNYEDFTVEMLDQLLASRLRRSNDFWDLEIDVAHNYRYYFKKFNADQLRKNGPSRKSRKACLEPKAFRFQEL